MKGSTRDSRVALGDAPNASFRGDRKPWRSGTEVDGDRDTLQRNVISRKLSVPNAERTGRSDEVGSWC